MNLPTKCQQMSSGVPEFMVKNNPNLGNLELNQKRDLIISEFPGSPTEVLQRSESHEKLKSLIFSAFLILN